MKILKTLKRVKPIPLLCMVVLVVGIVVSIVAFIFTSIDIGDIGSDLDNILSLSDNETTGGMDMSDKVETRLQVFMDGDYSTDSLSNGTILGYVLDVPYINQTIKYPTGCESVSTTSVLQYYGIDVSVDDFIDNYLPTAELELIGYDDDGERILSGEDPNEYFIGNPKTSSGLGCYEKVIAKSVKALLKDYGLEKDFKVMSHTSLSMEDIETYLDKDVPVIVWATQDMKQSEEGLKWYLGSSDEVFQYMKNEHCLVAIGYDDDYIYCNDSLVGRIAYPKSTFEDRYEQMGSRAVTIIPKS